MQKKQGKPKTNVNQVTKNGQSNQNLPESQKYEAPPEEKEPAGKEQEAAHGLGHFRNILLEIRDDAERPKAISNKKTSATYRAKCLGW